MANEGEFPKTDGDVLYASEANELHDVIKQIYTGSAFDTSQSGSIGNDEASHELDAISSTNRDYVKIKITGTTSVSTSNSSNIATVQIKAQIKEIGGSYADIIEYKNIDKTSRAYGSGGSHQTYEIVYELSSGMKTNGFQIKVYSKSIIEGDNAGTSSFSNSQTIVELA
jgi:hypothetical protein